MKAEFDSRGDGSARDLESESRMRCLDIGLAAVLTVVLPNGGEVFAAWAYKTANEE